MGAHVQCDCQFDRPTITVDGPGRRAGRHLLVLDDPALRDEMAHVGPSGILLDHKPRLGIPLRHTIVPGG